MNRRSLLLALAAGALVPSWAHARRRTTAPAVPEGPVTLGWRWVPGQRLAYRCVTRRAHGDTTTSRAEEWTWLARDVDRDGVATLEGRLTGFGGAVVEGDRVIDDESLATAMAVERARADRIVTVQIGLDGRLVYLDPMPFAESLPHRLLALRVPTVPVAPHDEWPMPGLVRPFERLLPESVEATSHAVGRLVELNADDDTVVATLETSGSVRTADGPAIHVTGTARWDTVRGAVLGRDLLARFTPSTPDPASNPGTLSITFWRVGG